MSFPFLKNQARIDSEQDLAKSTMPEYDTPVKQLPVKKTQKAWSGGKCHLRVWHLNDLPVIDCDESLKSDLEQIDHLTRSLAKTFRKMGCERYLLPPLGILAKIWKAEKDPLYRAFHQLRDYGNLAILPGYNGDITISKIY